MDDLFLVIILGKCGQGLLGGARDESWLLEPRHSGFLDFDCGLCMFFWLGYLRQPLPGQSKSNPKSWHRRLGCFLQSLGTWQVLEQIIEYQDIFYHAQEGWRKVQIHLESVRTSHWYNIIPSISVKKEFLPRQGSPSLLAVWSADHPHPGSWGWNLAEGRAHPFPPQERGQETSLQV